MVVPIYAQEKNLYRYDTIQIEQLCKTFLTNIKDTTYIQVCIPNNDVKPGYDLNYDNIIIICDDGTWIELNTDIYAPSGINYELEKKYGDTINNYLNNKYSAKFMEEYAKTQIFCLPPDSSLYNPRTMIWEGIDENGLCWKLIRMGYICISYKYAPPDSKPFYDFILGEYKFLDVKDVNNYRFLPLYKK